jgi:hypothetical protein
VRLTVLGLAPVALPHLEQAAVHLALTEEKVQAVGQYWAGSE